MAHRGPHSDPEFRNAVCTALEIGIAEGKWTVTAVAKDLGVSRQSVYKYLSRKSTPKSEVIYKACCFLGIKVNYKDATLTAESFKTPPTRKSNFQQLTLKEVNDKKVVFKLVNRNEEEFEVVVEIKAVG